MTELEFHRLSDFFPPMEGEEFEALVADIKAHTLRERIILYQGKVLDGRNRYRALRKLGKDPEYIREWACVEVRFIDKANNGPEAYVVSANLHRRHLTAEKKRDLIAKLIKAQPEKSDRQIAKTAKASPTFVGKVRAEAEEAGDVSTVDTRTDTKGRKQPARKQPAKSPKGADRKQPAPKPVKHDERVISPELGERVGRLAYRLIQLDRDLARELADLILHRGVAERLWVDLGTNLKIVEHGL